MIRYALYARKSDDDRKVTEKSIGEQVSALEDIARTSNLEVALKYEESQSAKVPGKRPFFKSMIKAIQRGEVEGILCWNINRLVRNMEEGGLLAQMLIDGQIKEIRTPYEVHRTGDNILYLVLQAATSTQYSLELVQSVSRGMRGHFDRGGINFRARQGYRNLRDPDNPKRGIVVVDEPRYGLIRKGFDMLLTGAYNITDVVRTLNETFGYRTRKTEKMGDGPLSRSHAYLIFRDPFYAGYVRFRGELKKGVHVAMLTDAEFARVQEILEAQASPKKRVVERRFAYTALMRCGHCGAQITAEFHRLKDGRPYTFYRCTTSKGGCTKKGMSESRLEAILTQELDQITIDSELCQLAIQNIVESLETKNAEITSVYTQQQDALKEIEQQLWRLEEMWLKGMTNDRARYETREKALLDERERLLVRAEASRFGLEQARATAHSAGHFVTYSRDAFLSGDIEKKRIIVCALSQGYLFFGPERRVEIQIDPLLVELVSYVRNLEAGLVRLTSKEDEALVEPQEISSESAKTAPLRGTVLAGRPNRTGVEVPYSLIQAIISSGFPGLMLSAS